MVGPPIKYRQTFCTWPLESFPEAFYNSFLLFTPLLSCKYMDRILLVALLKIYGFIKDIRLFYYLTELFKLKNRHSSGMYTVPTYLSVGLFFYTKPKS
jgi:hypothetical protein